ncbi:ATP-NAD kinase-like domain-containing protein [Chytridium lagenaria]|nr:ATP-NAD kinase-like domain-containing protein [Chytridium lagenaria]
MASTNDDDLSDTQSLGASSLHSTRSVPTLTTMVSGGVNSNGRLNQTPQKLAETSVGVREAAKNIGRILVKLERPSTVMLVAKAYDPKIIHFTRLLACHLVDTPRVCGSPEGLTVYVDSKFKNHVAFDFPSLVASHPHYNEKMKFWTAGFCAQNSDVIDFIVTLGGDGTVLYTSWLFQNSQVPPVIPFHLGSLGFLTNFNIADIRSVFERILGCASDGVRVNMRMRLSCTVWRYGSRIRGGDISVNSGSGVSVSKPPSTASSATQGHFPSSTPQDRGSTDAEGIVFPPSNRRPSFSTSLPDLTDPTQIPKPLKRPPQPRPNPSITTSPPTNFDDLGPSSPGSRLSPFRHVDDPSLLDAVCPSLTSRAHPHYDHGLDDIINDLVVDRGPSAFMSQLELYVDDRHLTTVQADGLVVGTPTGSTAYSLSAGGSITHPEVPSILVTPICPHTLSFRPMLLPDSIELRVQVPRDSRSTAWASFDGRHRIELRQGDSIVVSLSRFPMPTVCDVDQNTDWFESLRRCLHWNERARQKPFTSSPAPPSSAPACVAETPEGFCEAEKVLRGEVEFPGYLGGGVEDVGV